MGKENAHTIVIGGGFYGLRIGLFLYEVLGISDIIILEKEPATMMRASYVNQARVHNGYHYPRSVLTGYRSAVNFSRFTREYDEAIVSNFDKYYAVARHLSKINGRQFQRFCEKINAELDVAPANIEQLCNDKLIEKVFKVKEYAFDSHILRRLLLERIKKCHGIKLYTDEDVDKISFVGGKIVLTTQKNEFEGTYVLNCTYSNINSIHRRSGIDLVPIKHEVTEMCLVKVPPALKGISITVMDGPFFSLMPFPSRGLYSLSHVRYTPHESWVDNTGTSTERINTHDYLKTRSFRSNYTQMYNDVVRYIPALKDMQYVESIVEVKTVLLKSEDDDSRPILYNNSVKRQNYVCIMGGKLDNIYDVFEELEKTYADEKKY